MRRSPSICIATNHAAPRLACVKPVASVHPEPGSNSSLLISFLFLFQECCCGLCDRPCGWRWSGPAFVGHHQNGQKIPWRREPLCFIGFSELTKVFCLMAESSCTTLILSIVNLSMCYSGTPLREQRKTLQSYKLYLKPANFSRYFFFNFFFGSSETLRPSPDRLRLGGTSVPKASAKLHLSPIPSKHFPEKVHQNYVFKHIFNIHLQLPELHPPHDFHATASIFNR